MIFAEMVVASMCDCAQLSEQVLSRMVSDACPDIKSFALELMKTLHCDSDVEP